MSTTRFASRSARRLGLACLLLICSAAAAAAQSDEAASPEARALFAEMRQLFAGIGSRAPGMPGNKELAKRITLKFETAAKGSDFTTGIVKFRAPVFLPGKASITLSRSSAVRLFAMHPTLMRPGNLLEPKLATRLVYLGLGGYDDLEKVKGIDLDGAVALMDFGCRDRWMPLLRFGIKAFLFIGQGDGARYDYADSYGKVYNTEAATPRFFVTAADGARLKKACEKGGAPAVVTQSVPARWEVQTLENPWILIPGDDEALQKEVVVLTASYDANSVVPERATGAQSSGNLFLLLKLLDDFKARRPARSVILAAVNAHTDNFLGERIFAWHLLAGPDRVEDVRYAVARDMRQMRLYTEMYARLQLKPIEIDESKLHLWVAVLGKLDAKQEVQCEAEAAKKEAEEDAKRKAMTQPAAAGENAGRSWLLIAGVGAAALVVSLAMFTFRENKSYAIYVLVLGVVAVVVLCVMPWPGGRRRGRAGKPGPTTEPAGAGKVAFDVLTGLKFEPVLDLAPFTETDYDEAIDAVIAEFEAERSSFLSKLTSDKKALETLDKDIERVKALKALSFDEMKQWAVRVKTVFDDEKLLESWRVKLDGSTGVRLPIKGKLQDEAKRRLNRLKLKIMALSKSQEKDSAKPDTPEARAERKKREQLLKELRQKKLDMTQVLILFNKIDVGIGRSRVYYRQIAANRGQQDLLREYRDSIVEDFLRRRADMEEGLRMDSANDSVREARGKRPVAIVLSLDVNWHADRVGLCSVNPAATNPAAWLLDFGKAAAVIAKRVGGGPGGGSPFVDAMSRSSTRDEPYFFHSTNSPAIRFHAAGATAVSVRSVFANHGMAFSPGDTFGLLDPARVFRVHTWLRKYLSAFLADGGITAPKILKPPPTANSMWSVLLRTFTLDQFSGKIVPDLAIPGSLVTLYAPDKNQAVLPPLVDGDVVNCYRTMCGDTGMSVVYGIVEKTGLASVAYQMDKDFREVRYDIDKGRVQESKQLNSNVFNKAGEASRTLPMFRCTEFPVYDRVDPTLISDRPITVQRYWPISADSKSDPQKYGTHGAMCLSTAASHASVGPISVSIWRRGEDFEPERLILLTDSRRCVLNATEKKPEGEGFETSAELGPDFFAHVARDMDTMNRHRRDEMRGVSNQLVTDFLAEADQALAEMKTAKEQLDPNGYVLANYKAVGNEAKTYHQIRTMNTDMLKAIVLYMALMIPFCFFVQKLLFGFTRLEFDMLAFTLLFTATYVVFRFIHPAFRIAMNPEAIFIAFVLGAVGCFVTWVLHKRFETEMQLLFRNITGMEGNVAYATVGQTAMMIGVNNMKRRRIRTSLTTATIVLVVFTMLAFSSVSKKMQPTLINKADESPYTGIFFHWPAGALMDEETVAAFKSIYGDRGQVLVRRVLQPTVPMRLENIADADGTINIEAVIGLSIEENGFLGPLPLIHGKYFSSSSAREIILPGQAFEALKIPSDRVGRVTLRVLGEDLKLVGVMDDDRYRFMRDLNPDLPLVPRKKTAGPMPSGSDSEDVSAQTVDMAAVAFLPSDLAAKLGAQPFTVSVRLSGEGESPAGPSLWSEVTLLLGITEAKFHVGSEKAFKPAGENAQTIRSGIYYIGSGYRTSIGGLSRLLIPLLIAGSIILNTMLGTVYERKYEIAVYNAIGLNPTHIFLFFLAEAFVYGIIGSVAGYLIGQLLAMGLKSFDIVKDVNINFSSMMVGYAILFTIGLVLLSTIYPGIVATRTAVPSGKRKWALPDHDGQRMHVVFPFIYEPTLAPGVMYYLYDYFLTFTEQSIGDQIVSVEEVQSGPDDKGRTMYHLKYSVALAPFDLGVTQSVLFTTHFDEVLDSYRVHMDIERVSGQDTNWVTTNRPFLEKLRKLLIRWRNIDPTQHSWYVEEGKALFEGEEQPGEA